MRRLHDIVAPDLDILLVAINPAPASAERGEHFATPTNLFWRLLHGAGLTRRLYLPEEAHRLPEDGLGLVSLVDRPTKAAAQLRASELRAGGRRLAAKVRRWRPQTIALLGLTLRPFVLPSTEARGPGLERATFEGARVFVLPNPSGRNRSYPGYAAKLHWYRELARACGRLPAADGATR